MSVILNRILRFTIFHVKLQKMSEMLDIYNNDSTCVLAKYVHHCKHYRDALYILCR